MAKLSEAGLNRSALLVNTSTATNAPLKLNNLNDAKTYYVRGLTRFDKGDLSGLLPILTKQFKLNLITRKLISIEPSLIPI